MTCDVNNAVITAYALTFKHTTWCSHDAKRHKGIPSLFAFAMQG